MPMSREQAEQLLKMNPMLLRLGGSREAAVMRLMKDFNPEQIPVGAPAMGARPPREMAVAAAMGGPEVRPVTPAAPAPMKPGIPVMAPRPEAQQLPQAPAPAQTPEPAKFVSPFRAAAEQARKELDLINGVVEELASKGQPTPPEARLRLDMAQRKLATLEARAAAEEGAVVDPERAAIIARQEARIKDEEQRLASDIKRSPWEALTRGGLALMNPQRGASFISALGAGLGAGLDTYNEAKARAAEQRARLGQASDQAALQRIDALTKARSEAIRAIESGEANDLRTLQIANLTDEAVVDMSTQGDRITAAKASAERARVEAEMAPQLLQSQIAQNLGQANYYNMGGGRSGGKDGPSATSVFEAETKAAREATEKAPVVRKAFNDWKKSPEGKANQQSGPKWDTYQAELRVYQDLLRKGKMEKVLPNLGPVTGGGKARGAATSGGSRASLRYDTKTGTFVRN